jgi:hypothetical protein
MNALANLSDWHLHTVMDGDVGMLFRMGFPTVRDLEPGCEVSDLISIMVGDARLWDLVKQLKEAMDEI